MSLQAIFPACQITVVLHTISVSTEIKPTNKSGKQINKQNNFNSLHLFTLHICKNVFIINININIKLNTKSNL